MRTVAIIASFRPAEELLRWLYRERRLSANDLRGWLEALKELATGRLKPALEPST